MHHHRRRRCRREPLQPQVVRCRWRCRASAERCKHFRGALMDAARCVFEPLNVQQLPNNPGWEERLGVAARELRAMGGDGCPFPRAHRRNRNLVIKGIRPDSLGRRIWRVAELFAHLRPLRQEQSLREHREEQRKCSVHPFPRAHNPLVDSDVVGVAVRPIGAQRQYQVGGRLDEDARDQLPRIRSLGKLPIRPPQEHWRAAPQQLARFLQFRLPL